MDSIAPSDSFAVRPALVRQVRIALAQVTADEMRAAFEELSGDRLDSISATADAVALFRVLDRSTQCPFCGGIATDEDPHDSCRIAHVAALNRAAIASVLA